MAIYDSILHLGNHPQGIGIIGIIKINDNDEMGID